VAPSSKQILDAASQTRLPADIVSLDDLNARTSLLWKLSSGPTLLGAGVILRIVVFAFLEPLNNDTGHLDIIKSIVLRHTLPPLTANSSAFHPPLYHLIAAAFYYVSGSAKGVQVLSLIFSVLTLWVFYRLLYREELIEGDEARRYAFFLVCFLPQFVLYGLYVSNDTLTILLGALATLQVLQFLRRPAYSQIVLLSVLAGAGLLTKETFLAFLPILFFLVPFVCIRAGQSPGKAVVAAMIFLGLSCSLGSYKFIRNYEEVGNPFVSSLDLPFSWIAEQRQSYRGAISFFDINFFKLLASPSVSPATEGAYPLLFYGTFWYQHIPESNFAGSRRAPFNYLGSLIYIFALVPTAMFLVGFAVWLRSALRFLINWRPSRKNDQREFACFISVLFLLSNFGLILVVAVRHPVWSLMQGRLLFPSFLGLLVLFQKGFHALSSRTTVVKVLRGSMAGLAGCFALYFTSEIAYQVFLLAVPRANEILKRLSWRPL
jgi:Dolichyl-phosphate-mannose-protein mannosyltransferase